MTLEMPSVATGTVTVELPGRLGDPNRTLATDGRADPRMVAALLAMGLDAPGEPPPVGPDSPREEQLAFCAEVEAGFSAVFDAFVGGLAPVEGVTAETVTVPGGADNEIPLYIHRPAAAAAPLPCVVHLHGGGMVMLEAASPFYRRYRDELAATGLVVVSVEFRNGAGKLGVHPFPAGLDDCVAATRWVAANAADLGVSGIVVSGESGGGNLTLAVGLRAQREGWTSDIAGLYAQCPYISNAWRAPVAELPSLVENDHYMIGCDLMAVLAELYDPGGAHADDPTCWPYRASVDDLRGLPPHVISVNQLDPLRDEGLVYFRRLLDAGVPAVSRTVNGTCHAGDLMMPAALPDVYAATVHDLHGFAARVTAGGRR